MNITEKIDGIFDPESVAIIGASRTIGKWGFTFVNHLIHGGYKGNIYPVNPGGGDFLGRKIYRNLKEIPGPIDLAFILIPPQYVAAVIAECGDIGVKSCIVITAGFQELGSVGKRMEDAVVKSAEAAGIALVGPNCAGICSPQPMSLYCMMQPTFPSAGNIAILSQSGNIAGSMQHMLWKQDIGISRCVSLGNQAMLTMEDFMEYLIDDDQTKVVIAYIEGVSDADRFLSVARRLTRVKPFIVIKGGQTESGIQAARSHTGAIAGSGAVFDGLCKQAGIIRVSDIEDMFDTAVALLSQPLPTGDRVGIVANGGGWGVLTADDCITAGLDVVPLPGETLDALDQRLPEWWNRQNPVDLVAGMSRGAFFKAAEILCKCEVIDSLIILGFGFNKPLVQVLGEIPDEEGMNFTEYVEGALYSDIRGMNFILDLIEDHGKPVVLSSEFIVGADRDQNEAVLALRKKNLVVYPSCRRAAQVLARLVRYGRYRASLEP